MNKFHKSNSYIEFEKGLKNNEVTPYRVAKDLCISQMILSDWKHGKSKPKFDTLMRIADYLDMDASVFRE